ncbi:hypothetical protein CTRI78_v011195 [Colletotrichum trifolii]|uniref:Uncharacterized protein n=1 Tax=Colletotrichum trifolii TaxID=5466 RepID=A0A4R8QE34_COLTR|nr:hypothetical protein CTRI78_v011195 [Colletotrichum trifolii]
MPGGHSRSCPWQRQRHRWRWRIGLSQAHSLRTLVHSSKPVGHRVKPTVLVLASLVQGLDSGVVQMIHRKDIKTRREGVAEQSQMNISNDSHRRCVSVKCQPVGDRVANVSSFAEKAKLFREQYLAGGVEGAAKLRNSSTSIGLCQSANLSSQLKKPPSELSTASSLCRTLLSA